MELKDTISMMSSENYEERFKAEYWQLKIRIDKLKKMLDDWKEGKLNFKPKNSRGILEKQLDYMQKYLVLLEARAITEDIDLKETKVKKEFWSIPYIKIIQDTKIIEDIKKNNYPKTKETLLLH